MRRVFRFVFSRYFISLVLILAELSIITLWLGGVWKNTAYALIMGCVLNAISGVYLITKDTNPEYKIPWMLILITLPLVGSLLYLCFYSRPMRRREARLLCAVYKAISEDGAKERFDSAFEDLKKESPLVAGKALSILNDDVFSRIYKGSKIKYLSSGEEYFEALLSAIRSAEKFIFLEYFIISTGKMWDKIHEILVKKAALGVEVRVLYDDIGCMKTLPKGFERQLNREGISCLRFNKISPSLSTTHNNRNHRKICIVDGEIALTGGVNISDEYINEKERFGHWKDGGILIRGLSVEGMLIQFLCDWTHVRGRLEELSSYLNCVKAIENCDTGYYIPFGSGPRPTYERQVGKRALLNVINQAERYVYITSPYLIIDYELTEALRGAALRGVDVRIITPKIPDKKIVKVMTKSSYPYLMECGVKIYEYSPGFIHEKLLVSDDNLAIIGTINFDYRSLVHHYENALWIYSSPEIAAMKNGFLETVSVSDEQNMKEARLCLSEKLIRNLIQIFAPLL